MLYLFLFLGVFVPFKEIESKSLDVVDGGLKLSAFGQDYYAEDISAHKLNGVLVKTEGEGVNSSSTDNSKKEVNVHKKTLVGFDYNEVAEGDNAKQNGDEEENGKEAKDENVTNDKKTDDAKSEDGESELKDGENEQGDAHKDKKRVNGQYYEEVEREYDGSESKWFMGIVPYSFDTVCFDHIIAKRVRNAMDTLESVSCVRFKPVLVPPSNVTWLNITNREKQRDCMHDMINKTNNEIQVVLGLDCLQMRHVLHSLLHAIGFRDEVTHPQRDQYIHILWDNIHSEYRHLFRIHVDDASSKQMVEYDPMSLMHFHDRAFSKNGQATVVPLLPGLRINPSNNLSALDKMKLRLMFGRECNKRTVVDLLKTCKNVLRDSENSKKLNEDETKVDNEEKEKSQSKNGATDTDEKQAEAEIRTQEEEEQAQKNTATDMDDAQTEEIIHLKKEGQAKKNRATYMDEKHVEKNTKVQWTEEKGKGTYMDKKQEEQIRKRREEEQTKKLKHEEKAGYLSHNSKVLGELYKTNN